MHIHNIDFHYHVGQERHPDKSMWDFIDHARMTGRRVLGVTDHLNFFFEPSRIVPHFPYPQTLAGLAQMRAEFEDLKGDFPTLDLFFGPEIPSRGDTTRIPQEVIDMSDYFICEYPSAGTSIQENTEAFVNRVREVREFIDKIGKPVFIAHPFRSPVNYRLVKREIPPSLSGLEPRPDGSFSEGEVNEFFMLDVARMGEAAREYDVPLEINGSTDLRVRSSNLPAAMQMLWAAKRLLLDKGASFVPGSDQHGFIRGKNNNRMGGYVPFETFDRLGLTAADIRFLDGFDLAA